MFKVRFEGAKSRQNCKGENNFGKKNGGKYIQLILKHRILRHSCSPKGATGLLWNSEGQHIF